MLLRYFVQTEFLYCGYRQKMRISSVLEIAEMSNEIVTARRKVAVDKVGNARPIIGSEMLQLLVGGGKKTRLQGSRKGKVPRTSHFGMVEDDGSSGCG